VTKSRSAHQLRPRNLKIRFVLIRVIRVIPASKCSQLARRLVGTTWNKDQTNGTNEHGSAIFVSCAAVFRSFRGFRGFRGNAQGELAYGTTRRAGALFSARLRQRTWIAMHDAMRDDANVGILIARDWFPASHAAREHRIDRTRHLVERRVVGAGGDVHGSLSYT